MPGPERGRRPWIYGDPTDGQVPVYNGTTERVEWAAGGGGGGGGIGPLCVVSAHPTGGDPTTETVRFVGYVVGMADTSREYVDFLDGNNNDANLFDIYSATAEGYTGSWIATSPTSVAFDVTCPPGAFNNFDGSGFKGEGSTVVIGASSGDATGYPHPTTLVLVGDKVVPRVTLTLDDLTPFPTARAGDVDWNPAAETHKVGQPHYLGGGYVTMVEAGIYAVTFSAVLLAGDAAALQVMLMSAYNRIPPIRSVATLNASVPLAACISTVAFLAADETVNTTLQVDDPTGFEATVVLSLLRLA